MTGEHMKHDADSIFGYFIGFGFLLTAVLFVFTSPTVAIPKTDSVIIGPEQILPGARRVALADPPMIHTGSMSQRCSDCHDLFKNDRAPDRALTQHTQIVLNHGTNDACLNCHAKDDREKLAIRSGEHVGFDQVKQLCAQCHGPIANDWERGTHGKTIGYWDSTKGESVKLSCTQCHDPHSPAYKGMAPLPGPNTLRMGDRHGGHDLIDEKNPLQRWRLLEEEANEDHKQHDEGDHP